MQVVIVCHRGHVRADADGRRRENHTHRHGYLGERQIGTAALESPSNLLANESLITKSPTHNASLPKDEVIQQWVSVRDIFVI